MNQQPNPGLFISKYLVTRFKQDDFRINIEKLTLNQDSGVQCENDF